MACAILPWGAMTTILSTAEKVTRLVCAEHCRFYKPWTEHRAPCGAHEWLVARATAVADALDPLERLRGVKPTIPLQSDALLERTICTRCDHYPDACHHRSPAGPTHAVPCGGLVVLDLLLDRDALSPEDLYGQARLRGSL